MCNSELRAMIRCILWFHLEYQNVAAQNFSQLVFDKCIWQICEEEVFIHYTVGVNKQTKKT